MHEVGVDVEEVDLADDAGGLEGEAGAATDQAATADDADFHGDLLAPLGSVLGCLIRQSLA